MEKCYLAVAGGGGEVAERQGEMPVYTHPQQARDRVTEKVICHRRSICLLDLASRLLLLQQPPPSLPMGSIHSTNPHSCCLLLPQMSMFSAQLVQAIQKAQRKNPPPGNPTGVVVLNQPLLIDTHVGLMSFLGNHNKLGYAIARGSFGF